MRALLAILCVVGCLTACNAATAVTPPASTSQSSHRDSTWHLYVANSNGTISIYDPGGRTAVETISKGLSNPKKMLFSKAGGFYVLNCGGCGYYDEGNITVYGALRHSLLRTITEGLDGPADIALDSASNLYVANRLGNTVTVYAPGSTKVARTIRRGISYPHSLAIDSSDRLYVANCPGPCNYSSSPIGNVTVYDGSTGNLLETIPNLEWGGPIVVGPNGDLFASAYGGLSGESYIAVFPWGHVRPTREMLTTMVLALAVDSAGDTYFTECDPECAYYGWVQEDGPNGAQIRKVQQRDDVPNDLALAPDGNVYVSFEESEVAEYAPGRHKPIVRIKRDVYFPNGLAIGP